MAITAAQVKALREKTGAGMMDCKKALTENDGNEDQALDWLRQKGIAKAAKRADRATSEGLIGFKADDADKNAVIVEIKCETDFVAKSDKFIDFTTAVSEALHASALADDAATDVPESFLGEVGLQDTLNELLAVLGESLQVARYARLSTENGVVGSYIHSNGKLGVLVEIKTDGDAAAPELMELAKNMAMQVAAANPVCVTSEQIPAEMIAREREVYRQKTLDEGKPENIVDKIVDGRMNKFYQEICLANQAYIKEDKKSVTDIVKATGKALGANVELGRFVRIQLGA